MKVARKIVGKKPEFIPEKARVCWAESFPSWAMMLVSGLCLIAIGLFVWCN